MSSLYISKTGESTWRVNETYYEQGVRKSRTIPRESYLALGINPSWSMDQARERIKQLNKQTQINKRQVASAARAAREIKRIKSAFLPDALCADFEAELKLKLSKQQNEKTLSHWKAGQLLIADCKIEPKHYSQQSEIIYKYFENNHLSPSYCEKIIAVLNRWGKYVSRQQASFFEPLDYPRGAALQRIKRAYRKSPEEKPYRGPSAALLPAALEAVKSRFPSVEQYNWAYVTVWFGLRPEETTQLLDSKTWYVENEALYVYQSKLSSLDEEDRWKFIPLLVPQQRAALAYIEAGQLETPLNKTLKKITGCTGYGGRKGFTDLMLSLGQDLEQISLWMGHADISRTWRSYKSKKVIKFNKVS